MTLLSDMFPGSFLKASDLNGREYPLVIDHVKTERMTTSDEEKYVVYFEGAKLGLVLNKTNGYVIGNSYGNDTDHWKGCRVVLFTARVDYAGSQVDAIRIKIPASNSEPVPAPVPSSLARAAATFVAAPPAAPVAASDLPGGEDNVPF